MTEQGEGLLGSSALVPEGNRYLHNQRLGLIQNLSGVDKYFLFYIFNSEFIRQQIRASCSGVKVRHTSPSRIYEVKLDIPPLRSQQKIATILSTYDDLIENNLRRIKILEDMTQTLYREWFVKFRFPNHQHVRFVDSSLGRIPEGWMVLPFSEMANFVNGYAFMPKDLGCEGKPVIKIRELKAGITSDTPRNIGNGIPEKYHISDGDVLFSWSADLNVYLWRGGHGLLNQHLFNVLPFTDYTRSFCFYSLQERMHRFRELSLGSTMQHIKRSALEQVCCVVPTSDLQYQLVA